MGRCSLTQKRKPQSECGKKGLCVEKAGEFSSALRTQLQSPTRRAQTWLCIYTGPIKSLTVTQRVTESQEKTHRSTSLCHCQNRQIKIQKGHRRSKQQD